MADTQDPLAALQQLLDEQKQQGAAGSGASQADASTESAEPAPPAGPTAEEIAALAEQKQAEDQQQIAEQLARMQSELKDTPQYQARLSQKEASEAEQARKELEERSKRIFQLKHLDS